MDDNRQSIEGDEVVKSRLSMVGAAGEGWKCEIEASDLLTKDSEGSVSTWLLNCPGQSPAWSNYVIGCVHLRPIEGVKPAKLRFPEATHEIFLAAIDPGIKDLRPTNMLEKFHAYHKDTKHGAYLSPLNYVHQWGGLTDAQAATLTDVMAIAIVNGILPAEPSLSGGDYWTKFLDFEVDYIKSSEVKPPVLDPAGFGKGKARTMIEE